MSYRGTPQVVTAIDGVPVTFGERTPIMYDYRARCHRQIGPLTLLCEVDLGFDIHHLSAIRLEGLAQPTTGNRQDTLDFVKKWLDHNPEFILHSVAGKEKYGRYLGIVIGSDNQTLNTLLLNTALVTRYPGDTPQNDDA